MILWIQQQFLRFYQGWDRFWFTPADPTATAILRILVGGMLLYTHCVWGLRLEDFLGDQGWNHRSLVASLQADSRPPSFWWLVPSAWLVPVHWFCNGLLLAFVLGLGGRFISVAAWIITISYAHRGMLSNFGLDQLNSILTLYLAIGPCTQVLSLDALRRRYRTGKATVPLPSITANVSLRLVQLHLCLIYLWAGFGKLQGDSWWNGEAVWLAIANTEYRSFDLTWLAHFPRLTELLTHMTIAWEVFFIALVWPRAIRGWVLAMGIGMHLGIGAFLGMWTFGLIMIFAYVAFIPSEVLRHLLGRYHPGHPQPSEASPHLVLAS